MRSIRLPAAGFTPAALMPNQVVPLKNRNWRKWQEIIGWPVMNSGELMPIRGGLLMVNLYENEDRGNKEVGVLIIRYANGSLKEGGIT